VIHFAKWIKKNFTPRETGAKGFWEQQFVRKGVEYVVKKSKATSWADMADEEGRSVQHSSDNIEIDDVEY
jgi:hypothetical protein